MRILIFDRLDYMNNLCRYICSHTPDEEELQKKYQEVKNRPPQHPAAKYCQQRYGRTGFRFSLDVIYKIPNCSGDCLSYDRCCRKMVRRRGNLFVYNTDSIFLIKVIIILSVKMDSQSFGTDSDWGIMLLISGLSTTNGIREILQKRPVSRIYQYHGLYFRGSRSRSPVQRLLC